jgi:putative transposase
MALSKAMLDELTAGYKTPQELESLYSQMLQHMINRALKAIYQSATAEEAQRELDAFEASWGAKYKSVLRLWRGNWDNVIPFFQFLPEIRKVIYTTNAIESLNMVMRKYTRNRRIFPNDDAALKALFMAIREASKNWKMIHHWKPALQSFQLMFGEERVPLAAL